MVTQTFNEDNDIKNGSSPLEEQRRVYHYHFQVIIYFSLSIIHFNFEWKDYI